MERWFLWLCTFTLKKTTPTRLVEVNLEEGETLTYQVDQDIEVQVGNVQKGKTILTAMIQYVLVSFKSDLTVTILKYELHLRTLATYKKH